MSGWLILCLVPLSATQLVWAQQPPQGLAHGHSGQVQSPEILAGIVI